MKGKGRAPTISDVAKAAGVDRSSVSRAFGRPELLSTETVAVIKAAAERLGYVPNRSAQALSTGRHGNIALIVPDVANPFFPRLIRAAQEEADRADVCVFLGNTDEDVRQEERLLGRLQGKVDGIVLASPQLPDDELRAQAEVKPLVVINRDVRGLPRVFIDAAPGIFEAVEHLVKLGHRTLAYVSGPGSSWTNKLLRSTARKAAARHKLELLTVSTHAAGYEAGRLVVPELLQAGVTGILAFDGITAQGVIVGLGQRGVAVPGKVAVVGCDDVLQASSYPSLTTVSSRSGEAGKVAVGLLMEIINTKGMQDVRYVLDSYLTIRGTA